MWELQEQIDQLVQKYFDDSSAVCVNASAVGLDDRAGTVYVSTDERWIAVIGSTSSIDYYGGFEYVSLDYKVVIDGTTFYSGDHSRVDDAIDYYCEHQG
tara:strand:+ start:493 stop:789 length:297 start_codon:yes stop_codon:yes gene_type:complete